MADAYTPKRVRVADIIKKWNSGTITLTRSTPGTPDPSTPWIPAEPTTVVYTLDARANGVAVDYVDEVTVVASDLMVIASPKARAAGGAVVDIEPHMTDALHIDGAYKAIKRIDPVPSSGAAALFHIFVAS